MGVVVNSRGVANAPDFQKVEAMGWYINRLNGIRRTLTLCGGPASTSSPQKATSWLTCAKLQQLTVMYQDMCVKFGVIPSNFCRRMARLTCQKQEFNTNVY